MKKFKSYADAGSILIGTTDFGILISNDYGDCETTIIVGTQEDLDAFNKKFLTCLDGKFNIYRYDCCQRKENDILTTLNGKYGIYNACGTVYFEEWR